jgi:hypothetical protein
MSKRKSTDAVLTVVVSPAPRSIGRYEARLDGDDRVLCVSRTPFFDAARELVAGGYDPNVTLILRHAGSDTASLRATVAAAARLTVEETDFGPRGRPWKPISTMTVRARIAPDELAATTLAAPAVASARRKRVTSSALKTSTHLPSRDVAISGRSPKAFPRNHRR